MTFEQRYNADAFIYTFTLKMNKVYFNQKFKVLGYDISHIAHERIFLYLMSTIGSG